MEKLKKAITLDMTTVLVISVVFVIFFTAMVVFGVFEYDVAGKCLTSHMDALDNLFSTARGMQAGKVRMLKLVIRDCVEWIKPSYDCRNNNGERYCIKVAKLADEKNISTKGVEFTSSIDDCNPDTTEKELIPGNYTVTIEENRVTIDCLWCNGNCETTCPCS
jgi:hypothetical protein